MNDPFADAQPGLSGMQNVMFWREKLAPFTAKSSAVAVGQVLSTLVPLALIWVGYAYAVKHSWWVVLPFGFLVSLFYLRAFVLMHDCGHGSLFASKRANALVGYLLGVVTGMPQAVWARNHAYHHNTNGDWVKYGGVFNILSTDRFLGLSKGGQRNYWLFRQPLILVPAGFFYVLFNPRFNWLVGTLWMVAKIVGRLLIFRFSAAVEIARRWETRFWKSRHDYLHMTLNNLGLALVWVLMCRAIGTAEFFALYVFSTSFAGSFGILIFTIQHNFEGSYATTTEKVDPFRAALEGTSMLVLPGWLNWFSADIAYHHLHHLSIAIPNYRLAACHRALEPLFSGVKRVRLGEVLTTFDYQLWDREKEKVVARDFDKPKPEPAGTPAA